MSDEGERPRSGSGWELDSPIVAGRSGAHFSVAEPQPCEASAEDSGDANEPHPFSLSEDARYEPVAELGIGGMGRVISAIDHRLQRQVALKQVVCEVRGRPGIERRFAREAWITAALDHPAIVPIFDAGQQPDGALYYTMRLIRGRTLTEAIAQEQGLANRLTLLRQFLVACEAVAYAHSQGVVHRDLKPDNILVGEFGETQVVDWGLARKLDEPAATDSDPASAALSPASEATEFGSIIGTPAYMSPEQAAGEPADCRSDVFSLGRVLSEIISGKPLFRNSDAQAALTALRRGEPSVLSVQQLDAPKELVAIVDKALSMRPDARYPDARALAADIGFFLDGRRVSAHRYSLLQELVRRARPYRLPLFVALVGMLLLSALAIWAWRRTRIERDLAVRAERKTRAALVEADLYLARALNEQALTAQASDAQAEAEVLSAHSLTLTESPDARGVLSGFALLGRPQLLERTPLPQCQLIRLRQDGALLCVRDSTVSMWSGRPLRETWQQSLKAEDAAWFSGGSQVAVSASRHRGYVLDGNTGTLLHQIESNLMAPRGWVLAIEAERAVVINGNGLSVVDGKTGANSQLQPCGGVGLHLAAAMNRDGSRLAVGCRDGSIHILAGDGSPLTRATTELGTEQAGIASLSLSPDGHMLIVAALDGVTLVIDADTGAVKSRHKLNNGIVRGMSFSPDGKRMMILGDRGGATLWQPHTGTLLRRLPLGTDRAAVWNPQGTELLIAGTDLQRWSLPGSLPRLRLLEPNGPGLASATLSPDTTKLAITRGDGTLELLDTASGALLFRDRFQSGVLKGASFLKNGAEILAWGMGPPTMRLYDSTGNTLNTYSLYSLRRAAVLPSGWIVGLKFSHRIALLDPRKLPTPIVEVGEHEFFDSDQTEDGKTVMLTNLEGELWEVRDQGKDTVPTHRRVLRQPGTVAVAVSRDGSEVALAQERSIRILDVAKQSTRLECQSPGRRILDVALSRDGRFVAAADLDQTARVWSVRDGRLLAVLRGHSGRVATVAFSADGSKLITASWDGSARLWGLDALDKDAAKLLAEAQAAWGLDLSRIQESRLY